MINLIVNMSEKIAISSLSVSNDHFIANFKLNAFKATTFDGILFEIKMKLNKSFVSFSTIAYIF